MGLRKSSTLKLLDEFIIEKFGGHKNVNMIELGNIIIREINTSAKKYFSKLGVNHTSIDCNGKDGALPLDLRTVIDDDRVKPADIVTNCGTTEHVKNQYMCFKNIHNFAKPNGFLFHLAPPLGKWRGHCSYYYTEEFFNQLALQNNYEILEKKIIPNSRNHPKAQGSLGLLDFWFCVMQKKKDNEFIPERDWTPPVFLSEKEGGHKSGR
jgi:hypothetical protein